MSNVIFNEKDGTIQVKHVRLSYPHLFKPWAMQDDQEKKFSARFLLPKDTHAAEIKAIQAFLTKMMAEKFKARIPLDKLFLRDGDATGKPEDEGHCYISASDIIRPQVIGKRREPLTEEDDVVYGGVIVNALIRPWAQDNKFGKRINANLVGVQFVKEDGVRFGQARPDVNEHFDDEGGEDGSSGGDGFGDDDIPF